MSNTKGVALAEEQCQLMQLLVKVHLLNDLF